MTIQLQDIDSPYEVATIMNSDGKEFIELRPNAPENICLDYDGCQELIRTLQFISNEIKPKDK